MTEEQLSKPWYKKWWGIILIVLFFPLIVPYLVWTKTTWAKWIKITITAVCFILIISNLSDSNEAIDSINQNVIEKKAIENKVQKQKIDNEGVTKKNEEESKSVETVVTTPKKELISETSIPEKQTDRDATLTILKANASSKWNTDYQMVQYEYNNQVEAYDWVIAQTKYPDILTKAKTKWDDDFQMVKYEYNNQVEAHEWIMSQTEHLDIMANAKQKWDTDYQMVKYEYNNQVKAFNNL